MAEMEALPDLDLQLEEFEVKVQPVEVHNIPDMDLPSISNEQPVAPSYLPKVIMIKKQCKPLQWHEPEQDFHIARHEINLSNMEAFDKFIEANIPQDSTVRLSALKFIEDVWLGKISDHESKVFYNDGKNKSFKISFQF